ncbi:MAG: TrmB family transcriptional regulator [Thermoproteales archaeon]|nr:TrmB family transcriptional regulator [Thermoproteales archaeon]
MIEKENLYDFLESLGLTKLEAKVYLTLLIKGEMSVTDLAKELNMHFSQLYNVLSALELKGVVEVQEGRPKVYKAVDISYVANRRIAEIKAKAKRAKAVLDKMRRVSSIRRPSIWITMGVRNIIRNLIDLVKNARYEVLLVIHRKYVENIRSSLISARRKSIQTYLVVYPSDNLKDLKEKFGPVKRVAIFETYPFAVMGIADSSRAVISYSYPDVLPSEKVYGIVFDEPLMPLFLTEDFYQIWIRSKPIVDAKISLPASFTSQRLALVELKKLLKKNGKIRIYVEGLYVQSRRPFKGYGFVTDIVEDTYQRSIIIKADSGEEISIGGPYSIIEDVEAQLIKIIKVD